MMRRFHPAMWAPVVLVLALGFGLLLSTPALVAADVEEDVEELLDRVDELELKTAKDKISFFGDFRVKYDWLKWQIPAYQQLVGLDFSNPSFPQGIPVAMPVPAQEIENNEAWSARLRIKLDAKISDEVHFTGRLNMNRAFGGSSVPIFNGFPNTVLNDFNSTAIPTDDNLRVERAAFTWSPEGFPLFLTAGRQAATGGPPSELREDRVRQGTPGALMIDAQIDGFMLGFRLREIGLPDEAIFRFCYGTGFEAGFGSGGAVANTRVNVFVMNASDPNPQNWNLMTIPMTIGDLEDSKVMGGCGETPLPFMPGKSLLSFGYFRMQNMTDIPSGWTRSFPNGMSTQPQFVTATTNLGDMDLYGLCFQNTLDLDGYELDYFGSWAANKSHPDAGTASLYGFGPLLGSDTEENTGMSYYVGARGDVPPTGGKIGVEFNHGDENWFSYTPAADDINQKLAVRGDVFEVYYIQPLTEGLNWRVGYQGYKYTHAFSGWHIAPQPLENYALDQQPLLPYAFPDEIQSLYSVLDLDF